MGPNGRRLYANSQFFGFQFENCERFWFQPKREDEKIRNIFKALNSGLSYGRVLVEIDENDDIEANGLFAARDKSNGLYYRARIVGTDFDESSESLIYSVVYIDYGHTGVCKREEMRRLLDHDLKNLPPRCFECRLAEVHPAIIHSETNDWSQEANETFRELIEDADSRASAEVSPIIIPTVYATVYVFIARKRRSGADSKS